MAGQDKPHTQHHSDVASDAIDMQTAENPKSWDVGNDSELNGDTDGAQTAGKRAHYATENSSLPKGVSEGTADIGATDITMPTDGGHGASNAAGKQERQEQEKVLGK